MRFSFSIFVALAVVAGLVGAQDVSPSAAQDAFDKAGIPKDLNLTFKPKGTLQVSFPQQAQEGNKNPDPVPVKFSGAQIPENNTSKPPTFSLSSPGKPVALGNGPFVIALVDPDAPSSNGPVRHFLGGGFTFKDDGSTLVNNTAPVTEYQPPSTAQGSDAHRIVFLVFDQPDNFADQKEVTPETGRDDFDISKFADKVGLGEPVAGAYMKHGQMSWVALSSNNSHFQRWIRLIFVPFQTGRGARAPPMCFPSPGIAERPTPILACHLVIRYETSKNTYRLLSSHIQPEISIPQQNLSSHTRSKIYIGRRAIVLN